MQKLFSSVFFICITFFISTALTNADTCWTPAQVPAESPFLFVLYYQQFLHQNPFPINHEAKTEEEKAENRKHHEQAAVLYGKMSEVAAALSQSPDLIPAAPAHIKRNPRLHIRSTWRIEQNIPLNADDLLQESVFMQYQALSHTVSAETESIETLWKFADDLEQRENMDALFQWVKRQAGQQTFMQIRFAVEKNGKSPILKDAVRWYAPLIEKYPTEENIKTVDSILETVELFHRNEPGSKDLTEITAPLRNVFAAIKLRTKDKTVLEYAEVYEGTLRRLNIIGKDMPIWGTDLSGKVFEAKQLDGKVVLLDFWATWCGPCVGEFPHLKTLYAKYKDKGFEIIGFSTDADLKKLQGYLERNPVPWIVLSKETTKAAGLPSLSGYYGALKLPVVLLRDKNGKAVLTNARSEKLDEMLEKLFKE